GLREVPGYDPRAESGHAAGRDRGEPDGILRHDARVGVAAATGQHPQEMRLAGAVGAEDGDPVAVPDLQVERVRQAVELQLLADDRALAGTAAGKTHPDVLLLRRQRWRAGLLELAQPGLRRLVTRGHRVVVGRLLLVHQHQLAQLLVLLVPAPPGL